jgi:hypothetical protein
MRKKVNPGRAQPPGIPRELPDAATMISIFGKISSL